MLAVFFSFANAARGFRLLGLCLMLAGLPGDLSAQPTGKPQETIRFGGKLYYLAYTAADEKSIRNEYILNSESLDNWTHLLTTYIYYNIDDPVAMAESVRERVRERHPGASIGLQSTDDGKRAFLRFILTEEEPRKLREFNFWRYEAMEAPRPQIMAVQFAYRGGTNFEATIRENLEFWTHELSRLRSEPPRYMVDERLLNLRENKAIDLIRRGELNTGIEQMIEIVEKDPQNPRRRLNLGSILFSYGRKLLQEGDRRNGEAVFARSRETLITAIRLFALFEPDNVLHAQSCFLVGEILRNVENRPEAARDLYRRALEIHPDHRGAALALNVLESPETSGGK